MAIDLINATEVAAILGVSRRRVYALLRERPDFPPPVREDGTGRLWRRRSIERWAATADRAPGRRATPPRRQANDTHTVPTVSLDQIVEYVHREGVEAYIEQTDGDVATICAGTSAPGVPLVVAGLGWFDGTDAYAVLAQLTVGPYGGPDADYWQPDMRSTERSIASVIVKQVRAANGALKPPAAR
jgi:predicted DNA-binding transcriptional regulator AlpA